MATQIKPHTGPFVIDLQHLDGVIVDVADGKTKGLCREKEGWARANDELLKNVPVHAASLGVSPDITTRVVTLNGQLADVRALIVVVAKTLEVLEETEVILEDEREAIVGTVVQAARRMSKRKDPALLVAFEETIRYHGQLARQAVKTRRKKQEAAAAGTAEEAAEAQPAAASASVSAPGSASTTAPASAPPA